MTTPPDRSFVSTGVVEKSEARTFLPRSITTLSTTATTSTRVAYVRFILDTTSPRLRAAGRSASLIESEGAGNPCARRQYGWAQYLGPEQWEQGYVEMPSNITAGVTPPARFIFAQIAPDNGTECLNGLWGAVDATDTEVQAFQDAVAVRLLQAQAEAEASKLVSTTGSSTPAASTSSSSNDNKTNNSADGGLNPREIMIIAISGLLAVCICFFLFRRWLRWRRRRRDPEAGDHQPLATEAFQAAEDPAASTSTFAPSVSLSGQVVEHFVQDENRRIVMRAASVSSLPVYIAPAPPPPVSALPDRQRNASVTGNRLHEEMQDVVTLATSPGGLSSTTGGGPPPAWRRGERRRERERRRQRGQEWLSSPTRTVRSDVETLPDYMSTASRPPSFVSRLGT